ncbi:DUF4142 domain-containing protein [Caldimonas tepidiphila]|uniref:DUF4142 domain-containing protein n=1 Tax=Caldimonas tepidiphila TaxID=2315841 RepID=UPI0013004506|nr:DUF4142 domain-containing protein [Caldimonas tepidiphila]
MKPYLQAAALGCVIALSGCGMMQRTGGVAQADAHFMRQAAHSGFAEVEGSRLAQQKASNPSVRSFADRMVLDHRRSNEELAKLAASKGVDVPKEPSPAQQARIKALGTLEGAAFDRQYVDQMGVMAHENSISLYRQASTNSQDPEVKAFATRMLPALNMHLDMAKQLQGAIGR